ncbi:MAG: hypothetical protein NE334_06740 [Lentisphaeraceae bacterium]|nr:hypothetical protein [Lentisphaeraceae bacterium]
MRILFTLFILFSLSCKEKEKVKDDRLSLHGKWESYIIRSKEKSPPKKIVLNFTAYAKTKLTYMKMTAFGDKGATYTKTIRVSLEKKGYILPSIKAELKRNPKSFIWYNPKHKEQIKGLEWRYIISGNELTIEMGLSKIMLRRI